MYLVPNLPYIYKKARLLKYIYYSTNLCLLWFYYFYGSFFNLTINYYVIFKLCVCTVCRLGVPTLYLILGL